MINLIKYIDNEQYAFFKNQKIDQNNYAIYLDIKTKSKIKVFDANNNLITNKDELNEILNYSVHISFQCSDVDEDLNAALWKEFGAIIEHGLYQGEKERYSFKEEKQIISKLKSIFYEKFGNIISEEQLDKRIKNSIYGIYKVEKIKSTEDNIAGSYDSELKEIVISSSIENEITYDVLFHEFIHAIVNIGGLAQKLDSKEYIYENCLESNSKIYEYGSYLDEGIVSYIEYMKNSKDMEKFKIVHSYDNPRRLIHHLVKLYNNEPNKSEKSLIDEYIIDSQSILPKIFDIFKSYIKNINTNLSPEEIEEQATLKYFEFISKTDKLENCSHIESVVLLQECENMLSEIFISQINSKPVTTKEQLEDIIFKIEYFKTDLSSENIHITNLIEKKIKEFSSQNPDLKIKYFESVYQNGYKSDTSNMQNFGEKQENDIDISI